MNIAPQCEISTLAASPLGRVVRRIGHSNGGWGLTCDVEGRPTARAIINLDVAGTITYSIANEPNSVRVLLFEHAPSLELDPLGPFEPPIVRLHDLPGAVIRTQDGWYMRVQNESTTHPRLGTFDVTANRLVADVEELNRVAIFGSWSLYLGEPGTHPDRRTKLLSFAAPT